MKCNEIYTVNIAYSGKDNEGYVVFHKKQQGPLICFNPIGYKLGKVSLHF